MSEPDNTVGKVAQIPFKEAKKVLRFYLGPFYVKMQRPDFDSLRLRMPVYRTTMVIGKQPDLKRVGAYFLLNWGHKYYKYVASYEMIDAFLGNRSLDGDEDNPGSGTFYDTSTDLMIIYHLGSTMANRQLENVVKQCISMRELARKPTLILSECGLPTVQALMVELEREVVHFSSKAISNRKVADI